MNPEEWPEEGVWCPDCRAHRSVVDYDSAAVLNERQGQRVFAVTFLSCGHEIAREVDYLPGQP